MFSIYTSLYNLDSNIIDYKSALDNFCAFGDEIVVATTTDSKDNTIELLRKYQKNNPKVKLVITDFKLDSAYFDGQLKNAALKACTMPFCILLDGDEKLNLNTKNNWIKYAIYLQNSEFDAFLIPVIDLYNTEKEYKSLGFKWFLHKNLPYLSRGIVNFAKNNDGTININKSDSTELVIEETGQLCKSACLLQELNIQSIKDLGIYVLHYGWLDKQKRLKSNAFWQDIWAKRAGKEVNNIIHSERELEKIEYWPHNLPLE